MSDQKFACTEIDQSGMCKKWVIIETPEPMISHLTMQEWNALSIPIALCIVLAWGFRVIGSLI